ncbi:hypothetical protein ISN44_As06g021880 [Arabidopsis suecica]|uniref:Uncharacterized protein n=1 Tax=Arabidopsis suecica TaxID=45249 RepID=A0A8T2CSJ6_ARASU|nr:hypothetical protein ISN44_As06g021880 [Arabidopsis suecica]
MERGAPFSHYQLPKSISGNLSGYLYTCLHVYLYAHEKLETCFLIFMSLFNKEVEAFFLEN